MINIFPSQIVDYVTISFDRNWFQQGDFLLGSDGAVAAVAGLLDLVH